MIYIQTEGGGKRGLGHITRSIALYQALKELKKDVMLLIDKDKDANIDYLLKGINHSYFDIKNNLDYIRDDANYIIDTYQKIKGIKKYKNVFILTDEFTYDKPLIRKTFWKLPRRKMYKSGQLNMTKATGLTEKKAYKYMSAYKDVVVSGGQAFLEAFAIRENKFSISPKNEAEHKQIVRAKKPSKQTTLKCAREILKQFNTYKVSTVKDSDYKAIFKLRNSKDVRKTSFNKKRISWASHLQHMEEFKKQIKVCYHDDQFAGYMKIDNASTISIAIAKAYRGLGASDALIKYAKKYNKHLTAFILPGNEASKKFFIKNGFKHMGAYYVWSK